MQNKIFSILIVSLILSNIYCKSQTLINNGEVVQINNGAIFYISGDILNTANGQLNNAGDLTVNGNFTNNSQTNLTGNLNIIGNFSNNFSFTHNNGQVNLIGNSQNIGGTSITNFFDLTLQGNGIKYLNQNILISNSINLNDRELNIGNYFIEITNSNLLAILRTTGFISNDLNGKLIRKTNSSQPYLFPLGSSIGTQRYRPIEIIPSTNYINKSSAGFINHNASIDAYNLNSIDTSVCSLNNLFYYNIGRDSGTSNAQIYFYFDTLLDGKFNTAANWITTFPYHWTKTNNTNYFNSNPLSQIVINQWTFNSSNQFILANTINNIELGDNVTACIGDTILLDATNEYSNYLWSNGANTQTININQNGTYYVTVTNSICSSTDSIKVTFTPLPLAYAGQDVSVCKGSSIQLNASGGTVFNWLTTSGLDNPNIYNPFLTPTITSNYIVEVSDGQCKNTDTVLVTLLPLPNINAGNDTTIYENIAFQLNPITNNYNTAIWSPTIGLSNANILNPTATISNQTTYTITITDNNGCSNSDAITLYTIPDPFYNIVIHNTFTPNNDGTNETWYIENILQYPDNHLYIYNRNGHIVYEKQGYNNEWDGKYFGNELPEATYYYILKINDGEIYKGDVTIIR